MALMTSTFAVVDTFFTQVSRVSVAVFRDSGSDSMKALGPVLLGLKRTSLFRVTGSMKTPTVSRQSEKT